MISIAPLVAAALQRLVADGSLGEPYLKAPRQTAPHREDEK
jgi:hypothetical protein